jgi:hypothetical protein
VGKKKKEEPENTKLNRPQKPADVINVRAASARTKDAARSALPQVTTYRGARNTNPDLN